MTLDLEILAATPSLNAFMGRSRWAYVAAQKEWLGWVWKAWLNARVSTGRPLDWPRPPRRHVTVTIERITNRPLLDDDNFRGGLKVLLDALKQSELIADDSPQAITIRAIQTRLPPVGKTMRYAVRQRTKVRLEEADGD